MYPLNMGNYLQIDFLLYTPYICHVCYRTLLCFQFNYPTELPDCTLLLRKFCLSQPKPLHVYFLVKIIIRQLQLVQTAPNPIKIKSITKIYTISTYIPNTNRLVLDKPANHYTIPLSHPRHETLMTSLLYPPQAILNNLLEYTSYQRELLLLTGTLYLGNIRIFQLMVFPLIILFPSKHQLLNPLQNPHPSCCLLSHDEFYSKSIDAKISHRNATTWLKCLPLLQSFSFVPSEQTHQLHYSQAASLQPLLRLNNKEQHASISPQTTCIEINADDTQILRSQKLIARRQYSQPAHHRYQPSRVKPLPKKLLQHNSPLLGLKLKKKDQQELNHQTPPHPLTNNQAPPPPPHKLSTTTEYPFFQRPHIDIQRLLTARKIPSNHTIDVCRKENLWVHKEQSGMRLPTPYPAKNTAGSIVYISISPLRSALAFPVSNISGNAQYNQTWLALQRTYSFQTLSIVKLQLSHLLVQKEQRLYSTVYPTYVRHYALQCVTRLKVCPIDLQPSVLCTNRKTSHPPGKGQDPFSILQQHHAASPKKRYKPSVILPLPPDIIFTNCPHLHLQLIINKVWLNLPQQKSLLRPGTRNNFYRPPARELRVNISHVQYNPHWTPVPIQKQKIIGGGLTCHTSDNVKSTQILSFPNHSTLKGPIRVANLPVHPYRFQWQPPATLYYRRSLHPLDVGLSHHHASLIRQYSQFPPDAVLAYSEIRSTVTLTTQELQNLLTHGEPTSDNVLYLFLEIFCSFFNYTFMTEKFFTLLKRNGWSSIRRYFSDNKRSKGRSTYRPDISGEPAIAIPCFLGAHWIALVRREIQGQVYFLYSDDLNQPSMEKHIKQVLSEQTDESFYPSTAIWINCKAITYYPHSNECGPRTLLAICIMLLHPEPTDNILLEYMDPNLAQITRTWVAATILTGQPIIPPITQSTSHSCPTSLTSTSEPFSLIAWTHTDAFSRNSGHITSDHFPVPSTNGTLGPNVLSCYPEPSVHNNQTNLLSNTGETLNNAHVLVNIEPQQRPTRRPKNRTTRVPKEQPKITDFLSPTNIPQHYKGISPKIISQQSTQLEKKRFITDFTLTSHHKPDQSTELPTWGHALEVIDSTSTLRIILQNPNGLKTYDYSGDLLLNLQKCSSIGAGILCLPETNTNWSHPQNKSSFQKALKSIWKHSNYQESSSAETFQSNYQLGGTATVVLDRWTSRVVTKGADPYGLGRWSFITLRGSNNKMITIITGYRVCNSSPSTAGVKTAYMQQYRGLSRKLRSIKDSSAPNPRRQFILDLQAWLEELV